MYYRMKLALSASCPLDTYTSRTYSFKTNCTAPIYSFALPQTYCLAMLHPVILTLWAPWPWKITSWQLNCTVRSLVGRDGIALIFHVLILSSLHTSNIKMHLAILKYPGYNVTTQKRHIQYWGRLPRMKTEKGEEEDWFKGKSLKDSTEEINERHRKTLKSKKSFSL